MTHCPSVNSFNNYDLSQNHREIKVKIKYHCENLKITDSRFKSKYIVRRFSAMLPLSKNLSKNLTAVQAQSLLHIIIEPQIISLSYVICLISGQLYLNDLHHIYIYYYTHHVKLKCRLLSLHWLFSLVFFSFTCCRVLKPKAICFALLNVNGIFCI